MGLVDRWLANPPQASEKIPATSATSATSIVTTCNHRENDVARSLRQVATSRDIRLAPGSMSQKSRMSQAPEGDELWSPERWREEFEERAAIRQYDGHYTRVEAERLAWGGLENRWHREHGERVPADVCAGCRRPMGGRPALDVADGSRVHDTPDHACLIRFGKRWRSAATRALIEMGLRPPATDNPSNVVVAQV